MSAVVVEGLVKTYGEVRAVRGIDLVVETGEIVAVLGPNGAGKTTTVEVIEGYRKADGGSVQVLGNDPGSRDRSWLDQVGIVLQQGGMEDELTVGEAIEAQRRPYSSPKGTDEVIELLDLGVKRDERIKRLSGGQRRRLDVALALVGNPRLLFLDEPTTGFDPAARRQTWQAISGMAAEGTTVVLTTHYLEEAQALADRVVVMAHGEIVAEGPPDQLGDRRTGMTMVRFRIDPSQAGALNVEADSNGAVEIETDDAVRLVNQITSQALRLDIELLGLEVSKITLEEAYLRLVGPDE